MTLGGLWWRSLGGSTTPNCRHMEKLLQRLAPQPGRRRPSNPLQVVFDTSVQVRQPVDSLHRDHRGGLRADLQPVRGWKGTDLRADGWPICSRIVASTLVADHAHACALRDFSWPGPASSGETPGLGTRAEAASTGRCWRSHWFSPKRVLSVALVARRGGPSPSCPALGRVSFCRVSARSPWLNSMVLYPRRPCRWDDQPRRPSHSPTPDPPPVRVVQVRVGPGPR